MTAHKAIRIFVPCDSAAVSVGADDVAEAIKKEAVKRQLTVDLVRNGTRGMFWLEPFVEVETAEGRMGYGPVEPDDVPSLFEAGFAEGKDHRLSLGLVENIPFYAKQERLTFARCGRIAPLDLDAYAANGGLEGVRRALSLTPLEVVESVTASGLRGRGGAGFPTGIKWKTVHDQDSAQKYICCNADEGDSGTFADRMLMEGDPFSLIEGMIIAGYAVGASVGYLYIRSEYPQAVQTIRDAIEICQNAGVLGDNILDSGLSFDLQVRMGAGAYICGEESSMLESLEGKRGQVKVKPPIPAISGLFGKPTVVNNVLSLATVPVILAKGAKYYEEFGMGRSRGTQPFQLAGDIKHGGLVEKAFGVTLKELIDDFGGGTRSMLPVKTVQLGGPLGAYLVPSEFGVEMDYEALAEAGGMLGHGGIVIFNDTVDVMHQARFAMEFCEHESCGKCTPCRVGSVRGRETLDKIAQGLDIEDNLVVLEDLCDLMTETSLCAMGGLTPLPVRSLMKRFPGDFGIQTDNHLNDPKKQA